jgi:VIT1/CCC1 family predicted Fe2+/Mn2+ transporter
MLAVITGFIIIEAQLESLALKSFFSILALLIYLGILSLIKFNNLQLKNAVRMLLLSFIMILVSYSFSNAAINLS